MSERARRQPRGHGPAPEDAFVAVLERRGRFLTAQPLFPSRDGNSRSSRASSSAAVVGSSRTGPRAGHGELALVQRAGRRGGARVLRVLGRADVARDVIEGLLLDRGLARGFAPEVEREAKAAGERAAGGRPDARDLRDLPTFTIDPAGARDFDDAISAEDIGDGRVRIWVHIADVAAHVPEGSLVDREARKRATSVYAPGAVEPMLPHSLSSGACSLVPGEDRAAVTVELELELDGASVTSAAFYRSTIHSNARLDYERVDRIFAGTESAAEPWREPLRAARQAAAALEHERQRRGGLVIDSQEPEFEFDEQGNLSAIHPRTQTESHRLIEHLMIAANEAVALMLSRRAVPCLYRVHERPEPERVRRLVDQLASLEVATPPLPASSPKGEPMSPSQAAQLLGEISIRVEEHVRRTGRGRQALGSLVLRSLKQAHYSPENLGHAGLHSTSYCHFTSPIRRYPDLVCHRALLSAIGGREAAPRSRELPELGAWTSEREREAMILERDADDVARCFALERALYEQGHQAQFVGEVTGLISAGAFIAFGDAADFEGMLPVRALATPSGAGGREWWELNEQGTILHGERSGATLRLGDAIDVRVERVDAIRGRVDLRPAR